MSASRRKGLDPLEAIVRAGLVLVLFLAVAFGGRGGLAGILNVLKGELIVVLGLGLVAGTIWMVWEKLRRPAVINPPAPSVAPAAEISAPEWTEARIIERLHAIDWYQFEKFNAALLTKEGWTVERKGGATPDGGVDLVATKGEVRMLVQCKHWRTWVVQEKVIRELLGSMTHFQSSSGALHTLKGWTAPAQQFAEEHEISLWDGASLSARARKVLTDAELAVSLSGEDRSCPKCESPMIWRTGNFKPFWGCSRFPRCRATISEGSGAE